MKTLVKKFFTLLTAICMLSSIALFNVGCDGVLTESVYSHELIGTYHLTEFTKDGEDLLQEKGIQAYLVIEDEVTGYIAYDDNNTEDIIVKEVRLNCFYDDEDINKIKMLDYKIPGKTAGVNLYDGWENFGVVATNMHIQANAKGYKVRFEKVDPSWDLSYVEQQVGFGELPTPIPLN